MFSGCAARFTCAVPASHRKIDVPTRSSWFHIRNEPTTSYIALVRKGVIRYGVSIPDVPGCTAGGATFEQAVENATKALAGCLASMRAGGDPVPAPRSFEALKRDRAFQEGAADAIVTRVTLAAHLAEAVLP
jgi:predicted RNase H-like HicB family nuclease